MKSLRVLLTCAMIGGLSVMSTPGFTDDTELYRGQVVTIGDNDRPNILFVLDRTGSMDFIDYDENGDSDGMTRQDRLEEAMLLLLDEIHNVNAGLMTFANSDGSNVSLAFPVTNVDAPTSSIEGELEEETIVVAPVSASSDDAEQDTTSGVMNLTDEILEATYRVGTDLRTGITVESRIVTNSDDARELLGNGSDSAGKVYATSSNWIGIGGSGRGQAIVGLRFQGVNVPQGAEIIAAQVVFTSSEGDYNNLSGIKIYGVAKDNPSTFSESNYNISGGSRYPKTSASIPWSDIPGWEGGDQTYETPNIASIVQEIVNRGGWSSGNSMVFRIEREESFGNYPDDEHRRFVTRGESSSRAPLLRITYAADEADGGVVGAGASGDTTTFTQRISDTINDAFEFRGGGVGNQDNYNMSPGATFVTDKPRLGDGYCQNSSRCRGDHLAGLRFVDLDIPQGALITDATIEFTMYDYSNSDPLTLNIFAEDSVDPAEFNGVNWNSRGSENDTPNADLSSRARLATSVEWSNVPSVSSGNTFTSPNLTLLLQELVNKPAWDGSDNGVVFLFERTSPGDGVRDGSRRFYDRSNSSSRAAQLTVKWLLAQEEGEQLVGLRFQDVQVPQGATIQGARLEFTSGANASGSGSLIIHGEDTDVSETFTASDGDISSRTKTSESATWDSITSWTENETYNSPDIKNVIQEIVNRDDWCGGEAMGLILSGSGNLLRNIKSFDDGPTQAPVLRIQYDVGNVPENACINQSFSTQITDTNDDVEETVIRNGSSSGDLITTSDTIELTTSGNVGDITKRIGGFRFPDIPIRQGATILQAELVFTSATTRSSTTDGNGDTLALTIHGEKSPNSEPFGSLADSFDLRDARTKTSASVAWTPSEGNLDAWADGGRYASPDLTAIVQEIVNQSGWQTNNAMSFFVSGNGRRDASSFDRSPNEGAILKIKIEGGLGEDGQGIFFKPVRQRLKELIREVDVSGSTQVVDALYEATQYYRGGEVTHGLSRHGRSNNLVAHPGGYDANGSYVDKDDDCTLLNPNSSVCASERIVGGPPTYVPPENSECQANFIVLLSDGATNSNSSKSLIRDLLNISECQQTFTSGIRDFRSDEECGVDLASYIYNSDFDDAIEGDQNVTLYTIGFSLPDPAYDRHGNVDDGRSSENRRAKQYLEALGAAGGGSFFEANNASELTVVFRTILEEILTESTSFAAPTLSVNAFNQLFHNNEIYFALFQPDNHVYWNGNVKKFRLNTNAGDSLGQILDGRNQPAINQEGQIRDDAFGVWNDTDDPDGSRVTSAGAGSQIPSPASRVILTNTQGDSNVDLSAEENQVATDNTQLTQGMLGVSSAAERERLINWIRGYKDGVIDPPDNPVTRAWRFGDPLHGSPAAVTFGGTNSNPIIKIFTTSNDGGIRMLNGETGAEEWFFIPQDMLAIQQSLMNNPLDDRVYGIDGSPSIVVGETGSVDGIIDPANETVRLYTGMRRGGRNVYALDITPDSTITSSNQTFTPTLLWTIKGGTGNFTQLGQTWSTPKSAKIAGVNEKALIFGGGYDPSTQDATADSAGFGPATMGNAIYIVNAETGELLWWAGGNGSGADLELDDMIYSIPSDIALMDSDGDGSTDRLYVGDTGGQVWRIDLGAGLSGSVGGVLAKLAVSEFSEQQRRFFYPPDVVQLQDFATSEEPIFDVVLIGSGYRPGPLSRTIHDRLYMLRDRAVDGLVDEDGDGQADQDNPNEEPVSKFFTLDNDDLLDVTDNLLQDGTESQRTALLQELREKYGWRLDLLENGVSPIGEKNLSSPRVLFGQAFFTTFVPPQTVAAVEENTCGGIGESFGRVYALDILTGVAVANYDETNDSDDEVIARSDRVYQLDEGIPSSVLFIFLQNGIRPIVDQNVLPNQFPLSRQQIYWRQN